MISDPVLPEDIDDIFDVVLPYLQVIERKAGGEPPEDILAALTFGRYSLHTVGEDGNEGFCILEVDDYSAHVVSAAAWDGHTDSIESIIRDTASYVKQFNYSKLTFTSPRPAWRKIAKRIGALRVGELYEVRT